MNTIIKVGIADAHGIESYVTKKDVSKNHLSMFVLRASLNRQRHAVAYEIEISKKADKIINELLKDDRCIDALKKLKKLAISVKLSKASTMGNVESSWLLIPNPLLDPYN